MRRWDSFFWPFQKQGESIFVRLPRFCFAIQSLSYQMVSSKKNLRLLAKLSTENSYFRVKIFCLDKLQLPIKFSKEISLSVKCSQINILVNYNLTKFEKYWSNIAVFGALGRLYSHSPIKFPATKHTPMLPLNYSHCLLHNLLI